MTKLVTTLAIGLAITLTAATAHADKALRDGINGKTVAPVSELCKALRGWTAKTPWESTPPEETDGKAIVGDLVILLESRGDDRAEVCVNGSTTISFGSTRAIVDRIVRILEAGKKDVENIPGASDLDSFRQVILADLRDRYAAAKKSPVKGEVAKVVTEAKSFNFTEAELQ